MSDLMRKKKCRHGLIDPDLDVHQEHPEWAACMGFGLVPVEPVGTLTVEVTGDSVLNANGRAAVVRSWLPPGEYLIFREADDE